MDNSWHWQTMSPARRSYFVRLAGRILILLACIGAALAYPQAFEILEGMNFFSEFSPLHLLWGIWIIDMILQLVPVRHRVPLGSQKLFKLRFRPIREKINPQALKRHILSTTRSTYRVMILWAALIIGIGLLKYYRFLTNIGLFLIATAFYVCDLICVLIW
ncbi:MAG: hypothetical protein IJ461_06805 [Clostridia bacterium]|nr:hypothetical protein [Clostridia bacterium]